MEVSKPEICYFHLMEVKEENSAMEKLYMVYRGISTLELLSKTFHGN